jgi:carboxylesterase
MQVLPGAEPFSAQGDDVGVLVLHGFTGSPQSMRPLAEALAAAGRTVELPRLPGHGTTVEDMATTTYPDWLAAAEAALADLAGRTRQVVVAGLSMGGALSLGLAVEHPELAGLVLVNPVVDPTPFAPLVEMATGLLEQGVDFVDGVGGDVADPEVQELAYDRMPVRAVLSLVSSLDQQNTRLSDIQVPTLVLHSVQDHVVPPSSVELLQARLAGPVERVELANGFHVATIDLDKDEINQRAVAFVEKVTTAVSLS